MLLFESKKLGSVKVTLDSYHRILDSLDANERMRLEKAAKSFWKFS